MIWNTSLAFRIFCTLVIITCYSGCGTLEGVYSEFRSYEDHVDLSDTGSDEIATIRGEIFNIVIARAECWMRSPAYAKSVTVNAGIVDVEAECSGGFALFANFRFEALAGHEYLIRSRYCDDCIELLDVTTDEVIVKAPSCRGNGCLLDLSTGDDKALIREEEVGKNSCMPAAEQGFLGVVSFLYVNAGPVTIEANCSTSDLWAMLIRRTHMTASFDFIAKTGHTYTFRKKEKECMLLLDITSEEVVIACEPFKIVNLAE